MGEGWETGLRTESSPLYNNLQCFYFLMMQDTSVLE